MPSVEERSCGIACVVCLWLVLTEKVCLEHEIIKRKKGRGKLDGMYVIRIAERPEFYQDIAKKALEEIANCT